MELGGDSVELSNPPLVQSFYVHFSEFALMFLAMLRGHSCTCTVVECFLLLVTRSSQFFSCLEHFGDVSGYLLLRQQTMMPR